MSQPVLLILGGTAAYFLPLAELLGPLRRVDLTTPYGTAFPIFLLERYGERVAFASRHGLGRLEVSPPFVNARANLWAAHALGVTRILSWNGVGAINPLLEVHDLLMLDGLLDFTKTRARSFGDPPRRDVRDRRLPIAELVFRPAARCRAAHRRRTAQQAGFWPWKLRLLRRAAPGDGGRDIRGFRRAGADVVGMTLVPEVFLARELGLAYAALAYVTNYATGHEPAHGAQRFFGVEVGKRCLAITRAAAEQYL